MNYLRQVLNPKKDGDLNICRSLFAAVEAGQKTQADFYCSGPRRLS